MFIDPDPLPCAWEFRRAGYKTSDPYGDQSDNGMVGPSPRWPQKSIQGAILHHFAALSVNICHTPLVSYEKLKREGL